MNVPQNGDVILVDKAAEQMRFHAVGMNHVGRQFWMAAQATDMRKAARLRRCLEGVGVALLSTSDRRCEVDCRPARQPRRAWQLGLPGRLPFPPPRPKARRWATAGAAPIPRLTHAPPPLRIAILAQRSQAARRVEIKDSHSGDGLFSRESFTSPPRCRVPRPPTSLLPGGRQADSRKPGTIHGESFKRP